MGYRVERGDGTVVKGSIEDFYAAVALAVDEYGDLDDDQLPVRVVNVTSGATVSQIPPSDDY